MEAPLSDDTVVIVEDDEEFSEAAVLAELASRGQLTPAALTTLRSLSRAPIGEVQVQIRAEKEADQQRCKCGLPAAGLDCNGERAPRNEDPALMECVAAFETAIQQGREFLNYWAPLDLSIVATRTRARSQAVEVIQRLVTADRTLAVNQVKTSRREVIYALRTVLGAARNGVEVFLSSTGSARS